MNQNKSFNEAHGLVRELGLMEALATGLGTMIGAGIFVLSGLAAERAGPAAAVSYVMAGPICLWGKEEVDSKQEEELLHKLAEEVLGEADERVQVKTIRANSVVGGIVTEAQEGEYDLVVIGASEEWFMRNWLFDSIPDMVAERAPCSVLMVRKHEPSAVSWLRRRLAIRRACFIS